MIKEEVRDRIIKLRKDGNSTYEISRTTNLPRSTVSRILIRNGLGAYKLTDVKIENLDDEVLGEFLGIFAADGNCYKSVYKSGHKYVVRIFFSRDEKEYANEVREMLQQLFSKRAFIYKNDEYNVIVLKYNSKRLSEMIKHYLKWKENKTLDISLRHIKHSENFFRGFLRGFLDCDGHVDKNARRVSMFCVSKKMINQIYRICHNLKFNPTIYVHKDKRSNRKSMHFVIISRDDAVNFLNYVKPRNSKRTREWA